MSWAMAAICFKVYGLILFGGVFDIFGNCFGSVQWAIAHKVSKTFDLGRVLVDCLKVATENCQTSVETAFPLPLLDDDSLRQTYVSDEPISWIQFAEHQRNETVAEIAETALLGKRRW